MIVNMTDKGLVLESEDYLTDRYDRLRIIVHNDGTYDVPADFEVGEGRMSAYVDFIGDVLGLVEVIELARINTATLDSAYAAGLADGLEDDDPSTKFEDKPQLYAYTAGFCFGRYIDAVERLGEVPEIVALACETAYSTGKAIADTVDYWSEMDNANVWGDDQLHLSHSFRLGFTERARERIAHEGSTHYSAGWSESYRQADENAFSTTPTSADKANHDWFFAQNYAHGWANGAHSAYERKLRTDAAAKEKELKRATKDPTGEMVYVLYKGSNWPDVFGPPETVTTSYDEANDWSKSFNGHGRVKALIVEG